MKHLPGARESEREGSKRDVRRGATARGVMEKSWCVRVIERKEVTQSNTTPHGGQKYVLIPRGMMAIKVPQIEEIFGGGKNGGRKGVGSAIH